MAGAFMRAAAILTGIIAVAAGAAFTPVSAASPDAWTGTGLKAKRLGPSRRSHSGSWGDTVMKVACGGK
jgi:hypothetical protein